MLFEKQHISPSYIYAVKKKTFKYYVMKMPYTICHKNFMTHLFAYRLGDWEAVLSIAVDFSKAVISLLQCYQCFVITVNEYEFLFHNIFSFLMTSVSNMYNICSILYHTVLVKV